MRQASIPVSYATGLTTIASWHRRDVLELTRQRCHSLVKSSCTSKQIPSRRSPCLTAQDVLDPQVLQHPSSLLAHLLNAISGHSQCKQLEIQVKTLLHVVSQVNRSRRVMKLKTIPQQFQSLLSLSSNHPHPSLACVCQALDCVMS